MEKQKTLKFVCISDTHEAKHWHKEIPDGDVLIHSGDFTKYGSFNQTKEFVKKFSKLPHKHKVVIAGNHELSFDPDTHKFFFDMIQQTKNQIPEKENPEKIKKLVTECDSFTYLENSGVEIGGYYIWGSPCTPMFHGWAFMATSEELKKNVWSKIPEKTDILVTHGPPYGKGDKSLYNNTNAGCKELLKEIKERVKPMYHIYGHIHEGHGTYKEDKITFINCARVDIRYKVANQPIVFELPVRAEKTNKN